MSRHSSFFAAVTLILFLAISCVSSAALPDFKNPQNEEKMDAARARRVLEKILVLQDLEEKTQIDEFGFYLASADDAFIDHGDAFYYQSYHIAVLCQQTEAHFKNIKVDGVPIFTDPKNNKTEQIKKAWRALRLSQEDNGRIFRHPMPKYRYGTTNSGSISHDVMDALYYLAAEAKYRNCKPVVDEMGDYLYRFATYANDHRGEVGVGTTSTSTRIRNWLPLHHLLLLYGKKSPIDAHWLKLSEVTEKAFPVSIEMANTEWEMKFDCKFKKIENPLCEGISTTAIHLRWLLATAFTIEAHLNPRKSLYSRSEAHRFLRKLASLGSSRKLNGKQTLVLTTWAAYQNYKGKSVNRVLQELDFWPYHKLPTEEPSMALGVWGCTNYVWNHRPQEKCGGRADYIQTALSWEVPFFTAFARRIETPPKP